MAVLQSISTLAIVSWLEKIVGYEIIRGNAIWRLLAVLLVILITMVAGRIAQFWVSLAAQAKEKKHGIIVTTLFLHCLSKPIAVAAFALGIFLAKIPLYFDDEKGIRTTLELHWNKIASAVAAIAVAYAIFRLVDVVEYYLNRVVAKTATKLDDMLVPVIRKSLRITIAIVAALFIADNILEAGVRSILLSAGVGGVALALAAKDTIANFFGSLTIFADRPFQVDEMIRVEGHTGPVEEVGFRSTRIRTLQGHLVTIPNSTIANSVVENIGRRPFIRRTANITITYGSGFEKTKKAVEIIRQILSEVPEVNRDPEKPPRVYFSDFNDWSLNLYVSYWVKPADYWGAKAIHEQINFEIMKRFENAEIEFAFPSQTLYIRKEN
ncbi:MAG: mechanosensitive ion channel family protein [Planctomycetota bacterium]